MFITPTTPSTLPATAPHRRVWLGIGVFLLLAMVGLIVWLRQRGPDEVSPIIRPEATSQDRSETSKPLDASLKAVPAPDFPADADSDGVSDATEREKGTNPQSPDSDNDGFGDGEELFFRKTNPLQADPPMPYPGSPVVPAPVPGV